MYGKAFVVAIFFATAVLAQPYFHQAVYSDPGSTPVCSQLIAWRTWQNGTCQTTGASQSVFLFCVGNAPAFQFFATATCSAVDNPQIGVANECIYDVPTSTQYRMWCDDTESAAGSTQVYTQKQYSDANCNTLNGPINEDLDGQCKPNGDGTSSYSFTCNSNATITYQGWSASTSCANAPTSTSLIPTDSCLTTSGSSSQKFICRNVPRDTPQASGQAPQSGSTPQASGNAPQSAGSAPQASGQAPSGSSAPQQSGSAPSGSSAPQQSGSAPSGSSAPQQAGSAPSGSSAPQQAGNSPSSSPAPSAPSASTSAPKASSAFATQASLAVTIVALSALFVVF